MLQSINPFAITQYILGQMQSHALSKLPFHCMAAECKWLFGLSLNVKLPVRLKRMSLDSGRKLEYLERTHAVTTRTFKRLCLKKTLILHSFLFWFSPSTRHQRIQIAGLTAILFLHLAPLHSSRIRRRDTIQTSHSSHCLHCHAAALGSRLCRVFPFTSLNQSPLLTKPYKK